MGTNAPSERLEISIEMRAGEEGKDRTAITGISHSLLSGLVMAKEGLGQGLLNKA